MKTFYRITCEHKHKTVTLDDTAPVVGGRVWCRTHGGRMHLIVKVEVETKDPRKPWAVVDKA